MPFFSIIIPNFNSGRFLAIAVQSVIAQTFEDYEVIVVDNCSTDGSLGCIDSKDSRFRIYSIENGGCIAKSRNFGISRSVGEWVLFLDADDFWSPEKLSCLYSSIHASPITKQYDAITHPEFKVDENGNRNGLIQPRITRWPRLNRILFVFAGNGLSTSATGVRRSVLTEDMFVTDMVFNSAEDYYAWIEMFRLQFTIFKVPEFLGSWRDHSGGNSKSQERHLAAISAVRRAAAKKICKHSLFIKMIDGYFDALDVFDRHVIMDRRSNAIALILSRYCGFIFLYIMIRGIRRLIA